MTCVFKEYEIKTKMVHEQWLQIKMLFLFGYNLKIVIQMVHEQWLQLKMLLLFGYNLKIVICWGELTFGGGSLLGGIELPGNNLEL